MEQVGAHNSETVRRKVHRYQCGSAEHRHYRTVRSTMLLPASMMKHDRFTLGDMCFVKWIWGSWAHSVVIHKYMDT